MEEAALKKPSAEKRRWKNEETTANDTSYCQCQQKNIDKTIEIEFRILNTITQWKKYNCKSDLVKMEKIPTLTEQDFFVHKVLRDGFTWWL
jgi:hypothetical protein